MTANVIVTVEREFEASPQQVFDAWTRPELLSRWRGSPGWHVDATDVTADLEHGGRHHHVKVRDNDPSTRVATDGVYSEWFPPDVFVSRERITGDPGIDPDVVLELRVELTATGRGTLLKIIQGPYEPVVASWHGEGWEKEVARLADLLAGSGSGAGGGAGSRGTNR